MGLRPFIKVCCITTIEEASLAIQYGANAIGLVGPMPSGPGIIEDIVIKDIAESIPSQIASFLLTSETDADKIIAHYQKTKTNTIQLVDELDNEVLLKLREALPEVNLVQVIHVVDEGSIVEAKLKSQYVDAILLDSGDPNLPIKELGGTGRTHNWDISRRIKEVVSVPVILAGGLNANNVAKAIKVVKPDWIDLCSGLRTAGQLDKEKLKVFFNTLKM